MTERDALVAAATSSCLAQMRTMFWERRRCRLYCLILLSLFTCGFVYLGYFCPDRVCALTPGPTPLTLYSRPYSNSEQKLPVFNGQHHDTLSVSEYHGATNVGVDFHDTDLDRNFKFTIEGRDVLVFLHIQKTGGTTFGRHLVRNIDVKIPCQCYTERKRCDCENSNHYIWLFSRYSTGWVCGLHADWTELQSCVDSALDRKEGVSRNRRYRYYQSLSISLNCSSPYMAYTYRLVVCPLCLNVCVAGNNEFKL